MIFEQQIIIWLQHLSTGFLDWLFLVITELGDQYFFLAVGVVLLYVYNKKYAYKFFCIYFLGVAITGGLKALIARKRPYTLDGIFSIGEKTSGYSMPSGHAQSIANIGFQAILESKQLTIKYNLKQHSLYFLRHIFRITLVVIIVLYVLVSLSRLYLGQHYITDVLVGGLLAVVIVMFFDKWFYKLGDKEHYLGLVVVPIALIVGIVLCALNTRADVAKICGAIVGLFVGYFLEKKIVRYEYNRTVLKTILRVVIGASVALALQEGLKLVFPDIVVLHFIRYILITIWALFISFVVFKKLKI